jgi:hypothetical protein
MDSVGWIPFAVILAFAIGVLVVVAVVRMLRGMD